MSEFRLCFLTASEHLADTIDLSAQSQDAAIKCAEALADGRRMELWSGSQRLKLWPAQARQAS